MAKEPEKAADQNATATTKPVENVNSAGTAPATPTQATVAEAHAEYEDRLERAKAVDAAMNEKIGEGMSRRDAKAAAVAENKAQGPAPENKSA
ncbi:hypothetical protein WDZ11_14795 [Roseomonas mucosa]|uniref:hypothetical protein n=1 Tax=Roseomonas mucosa TaxID=207340 RepID=UPI0030D4D389